MAESMQTFLTDLERLLAGSTVVKKVGKKKIVVKDLDAKQSFKTNLRSQFGGHSGLYTNSGYQQHSLNIYRQNTTVDRLQRYTDYELMDLDGLPSAVLDIFSEESLTDNEEGDIIKINSDDENIIEILNNLFYDILNVDFNAHT
jgi:hypothetical protein